MDGPGWNWLELGRTWDGPRPGGMRGGCLNTLRARLSDSGITDSVPPTLLSLQGACRIQALRTFRRAYLQCPILIHFRPPGPSKNGR